MAKAIANVPTVKIQLRVCEDLYDAYAERAAKSGVEPEAEMLSTLARCREHNASQAIYLNDAQRNELAQLAGRVIKTPADLLAWARQQVELTVDGVSVPLSTQLAARLDSRRFGATREEHLRRAVTEQLEQLVGLR